MRTASPPIAVQPVAPALAREARWALWPLLLITLAGIALRFTGIGFLQPLDKEPDGNVTVDQVERMEGGTGLPVPDLYWRYYPHLLARLGTLTPSLAPELRPGDPLALEQHLARAAEPWVRLRRLVALLSALGVPVVYALARRFMAPGWSLLAAALYSMSFLSLWFAQQARPHAAAATFMLAAVLAALQLRARGDAGSYLLAGGAAGLAIASLQSGVLVLLPLVVATLLRERGPRTGSRLWAVAALALAGGIGWSFYPASADTSDKSGGTGKLVEYLAEPNVLVLSGHHIPLDDFNGAGASRLYHAMLGYEPVLSALLVLALALALWPLLRRSVRDRKRLGDLLVVLSFVVPYLVAFGLYSRTYQRFALPLVPFAAVLGAWGLSAAHERLRARLRGRALRMAVLVIAGLPLAAQGVLAWSLARARAAPSTLHLAGEWIATHVRPEEHVALVPPLDLPLPRTAEALELSAGRIVYRGYPWLLYQQALPLERRPMPQWNVRNMAMKPFQQPFTEEGLARLRAAVDTSMAELDATYAVVGDYASTRFHPCKAPCEHPGLDQRMALLRAGIAGRGELVARFSPDGAGRDWGSEITYQDEQVSIELPWAWRLLLAERTGPVVEVYRLR